MNQLIRKRTSRRIMIMTLIKVNNTHHDVWSEVGIGRLLTMI